MAAITWTDVAPRDGLQNLAESVPLPVKERLIRGLLETGVPRIEATSLVSPHWVPQLADAGELLDALQDVDRQRLRVLIPNSHGLDSALSHGIGNVLVTIAATDTFNRRNVNRDVAQALAELKEINVAQALAELKEITATAHDRDCTVDVALSVAFGCPFEGKVSTERVVSLCQTIAAAGADEIGIADTIGVATPSQVETLCDAVMAVVPLPKLSLHVHDTRGLGVANVLAAYAVGVTHFDGSAGGLGGCPFAPRSTGNVCSEDALQALMARGVETGIDLAAYCRVSEQLAIDVGHELPGKLYRAGVWAGEPMVSEDLYD